VFNAAWVEEKQRDRLVPEAFRAWVRGGQVDDLLLRSAGVAAADVWAMGQRRLSDEQRLFIERSRAAAEEEARRNEQVIVQGQALEASQRRGTALGAALSAVLAVGLGGFVVVGMLAAIAIPNFLTMQRKAKRAEVPGNVEGLKAAELAYDAAYDRYVPCGSREEAEGAVGKELRDAPEFRVSGCWQQLGWRPDGPIRGAYWVEVTDSGDGTETFTVHGIADVDGDGEFVHYTATQTTNATLAPGEENVY
jgi:type II secretory pathway pseudopilin PulG